MSPRAWRLLEELEHCRGSAAQMATDRELLEEVAGGAPPALRLYRWARPALSIGRLQRVADVDEHACSRRGVEVVRRPSGGRALLHGGDLTYAAALLRPPGRVGTVIEVYRLLAGALCEGLALLGIRAEIASHEGTPGPACFATKEGSDLRVGDRKLCGSAQARHRGAVLQHGSILLSRLAFDETDLLAGHQDRTALRRTTTTMAELGGPANPRVVAAAIVEGFATTLDVSFSRSPLAVQRRP